MWSKAGRGELMQDGKKLPSLDFDMPTLKNIFLTITTDNHTF